jgi:broad specificity phosphatase PhoE
MQVLVVTHPEIIVDPAVPVPRWSLSDVGIARMRAFARRAALSGLRVVWSSTETKAIEAAGLLAAWHGLPVQVHPGLAEIDRSATGYLPHDEHFAVADEAFANPEHSIRGWERIADAQARMLAATEAVLAGHADGDLALVCHGGVATLLRCALLRVPISRALDQPGAGHVWRFDAATRQVLTDWERIEDA